MSDHTRRPQLSVILHDDPDTVREAGISLADAALRAHPGDEAAQKAATREALEALGIMGEAGPRRCGCGHPYSLSDRQSGHGRCHRCRNHTPARADQ